MYEAKLEKYIYTHSVFSPSPFTCTLTTLTNIAAK